MDLLTEQVESVVLTPDTDSEAQYLLAPASLKGSLVMDDRGYRGKKYGEAQGRIADVRIHAQWG